jgi:hypothetical protein
MTSYKDKNMRQVTVTRKLEDGSEEVTYVDIPDKKTPKIKEEKQTYESGKIEKSLETSKPSRKDSSTK